MLANEPWPALEGLHVGLDELGYGEGADFLIEYRFAEGDAGRTFMGEFNFSDLPERDLMRSIRLFGEKVIPVLRGYEPF